MLEKGGANNVMSLVNANTLFFCLFSKKNVSIEI